MNADAAKAVLESFVTGAFDTLGKRLSLSIECAVQPAETVTPDRLGELLAAHPVALSGRLQDGHGAAALLLSSAEAARIAARLQDNEAAEDALDEAGENALKEAAPAMFGGGLARVAALAEPHVEPLEDIQLDTAGAEAVESLATLFGPEAAAAAFSYAAGADFSGEAVVLCSSRLEELLPAETPAAPADTSASEQPTLSPDEMSDILSGFGRDEVGSAFDTIAAGPNNIEMVLDIQLVATARLGSVEMPIGDILNLGPGSIIEMGQMVDQPVELLINNKLIAKGDVIVVDEKFGLRITEIVSPKERIESLR